MMLREPTTGDLQKMDEIWRKFYRGQYGIPSPRNILDIRSLIHHGEFVGVGLIKLFAEGVFVIDKDKPLPLRGKAVLAGIDHALGAVDKAGLEQFHLLTDDPHYIEVLQKHWGFRTAPETLLFKEIERG